MDPTVAFVMALLALLVALGGLTVSLLTYLRGRPPRPRWVFEVKILTGSDGDRFVNASATNRGRGVAHDVTLVYENIDDLLAMFTRSHHERVEFGTNLTSSVNARRGSFGDGAFALTWCEEPNLHRQRRKMVKFHLDAVPEANSRRARRTS